MRFDLPEDVADAQRHVRAFAREVIAPAGEEGDRSGSWPAASLAAMAEMGLMGVATPERYGGSGMSLLGYVALLEEIAAADASHATLMAVTNGLPQKVLLQRGSDAQRDRYLPRLASGAGFGAFCLSEPQAGSDAAALATRAQRDGDGYRLRGTKAWVTGGGHAESYLVFAVTDAAAGPRGISAFLVPAGADGLSFGAPERKLGQHAAVTTEVRLEDVHVPMKDRIGAEGEGFLAAMASLDVGRIGIAAQSVGIARAAFAYAVAYAHERRAFGRRITEFQGVSFQIADMATRIDAARLLTWRAADAADHGRRVTKEAAAAKLFASETAGFVTDAAVQILGGAGYTRDHPVERYFRDARVTRIYEGSSEIQRIVVSRQVLREHERGETP